jgi:hypothetical protein
MKKINLNIWQKLGVIFSLVWLIYFPYTQISEANNQAIELTSWQYKNCIEDNIKFKEASNCELLRTEKINSLEHVNYVNIFAGTVIILLFSWLTAFIVFYLIKVIYSGFKQTIFWGKLSIGKKWFVGVCYVYSSFLILLFILLVSGLYIETKVPYYLPFFSVSKDYNGYVTVEGTWKTNKYDKNDILSTPLQTSKIVCHKSNASCVEARAFTYMGGKQLQSEVFEYTITKWANGEIEFIKDLGCAVEKFTINLNSKVVNGSGYHLANKDCTANDEKWSYSMVNGFDIYLEEQKKARPYIVKVILSLFGSD